MEEVTGLQMGRGVAGVGAAALVGLWWMGKTLGMPATHAHGAASALGAFVVGAAVMGMPCVLQMSAVCLALLAGAPLDDLEGGVRAAGRTRLLPRLVGFGVGYLMVLIVASGALGLGVWALGSGPVSRLVGALGIGTLVVLALALLGALPFPGRPCRGLFGFLERFHSTAPVALGSGFAIYCAACCGPMLVPIVLMSGASLPQATTLSLAFGAGAGIPFALALASFTWAARTADFLTAHPIAWRRACGTALLVIAILWTFSHP